MKKYLYIFCTLTGAALMGCTDLDLIPEDTMAPENYFRAKRSCVCGRTLIMACFPEPMP